MSCSLGAPRVIALAQRSVRSGSRAPAPSGRSQTLIRSLGNWAELRSARNRRERNDVAPGPILTSGSRGGDDRNSNSALVARDPNIPRFLLEDPSLGAAEEHESVQVFDSLCSSPTAFSCVPIEKLEPARSEILCAGAATLAGSRCGVWADDQRQVSEGAL